MITLALRSPGFLPDFLFETQIAWWMVTVALAATMVYVGRVRQQKFMRVAGVSVGVATVVWIVAAAVFQTPQERLYQAHTSLAAAVGGADVERVLAFLAPGFRSANLEIDSKESAREVVSSRLKLLNIKSNTITSYIVNSSGQSATTTFTLLTQMELGYVKSLWELEWTDFADSDWKIVRARLLKINDQNVSPDQVIPNGAP